MLGKLLKYELLATARIFVPLYIGLMIVAIIASFSFRTDVGVIIAVATILLVSLYVALIVVTIIILIQRFYTNLLKDEGYLMFTLPVSPSMLISSKLIAASIWCILSMIAGAIAAFIVVSAWVVPAEVLYYINYVIQELQFWIPAGVNFTPTIMILIIALIVQLVFSILHVYVSLAIGQLPPFGRYKILAAVGVYIAIMIVLQIVVSGITTIIGLFFVDEIIYFALSPLPRALSLFNFFIIASTALNLILAAIAFVCTAKILEKKLNLE